MNKVSRDNQPCVEVSVADDLLENMKRVADMSEGTKGRVGARLNSIMFSGSPNSDEIAKGVRDYPELFENYREQLIRIENSLEWIDRMLDRVAL